MKQIIADIRWIVRTSMIADLFRLLGEFEARDWFWICFWSLWPLIFLPFLL